MTYKLRPPRRLKQHHKIFYACGNVAVASFFLLNCLPCESVREGEFVIRERRVGWCREVGVVLSRNGAAIGCLGALGTSGVLYSLLNRAWICCLRESEFESKSWKRTFVFWNDYIDAYNYIWIELRMMPRFGANNLISLLHMSFWCPFFSYEPCHIPLKHRRPVIECDAHCMREHRIFLRFCARTYLGWVCMYVACPLDSGGCKDKI